MTLLEALRAIPQEVRSVRIDVEGKAGRVTAPMPEGQITVKFDAESGSDSCAVDGKVVRLARALTGVGTATKRGDKLRISAGNGSYSFSVVAGDSVPLVTEPFAWSALPVTAKALQTALAYVRTAAATDDIRYYLNGVLVHIADEFTAVASNGHVAAIAIDALLGACAPTSIILPNKCVSEIVRLLAAAGSDEVVVETGRRESGTAVLRVIVGPVTYLAVGIDGTFPEYQRVFAANEAASYAAFEAEAVSEAVKRLELTVQPKNPSILMTLADGSMKLASTADPDKGGSETVAAAETFAGQHECGVNPYYLADAVNAALGQAKNVAIGWLAPERAITIQPMAEEGKAATRKWIVMPLRV